MTEESEQLTKENKENSKSNVSSSRAKGSANKTSSTSVTNTQRRDKTRDTQQTRVVIRHLPPTMTSEEFLESISPIPEHNDYYFCRAELSLGAFGFCRAYINFLHMEDLFVFKDKFDGYVFVDTKGNEFVAIVEFAPFQRIPRRRFGGNGQPITAKKRDNKSGTIELDSDYIQFLEDLEKMKNETNMPSADVYLEEIEARDKQLKANHGVVKVSTPLIEFIKNRKLEKNRLREERREERKRQQLDQKRVREEEQQKKLKLLKSDEKSTKDSEQRGREKTEKSKSEEERLKQKPKDFDKRSRTSKISDNKRTDVRKSEKRSNQYKNEKPKDYKELQKESKNKESTFVVKVAPNPEESNKSETNNAIIDDNELRNPDNNKESSKNDEWKGDKNESTSTNTNDNSAKNDAKRIRNKDRPTREIYRPGATKRSGQSDSGQSNAQKSSTNKSEQSTGYKQRVFTRSKH